MKSLAPEYLVTSATNYLGQGEEKQHPPGRLVEQFLRQARQPIAVGAAWDTAFVSHGGYWGHWDNDGDHSGWPLPITAKAHELFCFAEERGVLHEEPEYGDVFV